MKSCEISFQKLIRVKIFFDFLNDLKFLLSFNLGFFLEFNLLELFNSLLDPFFIFLILLIFWRSKIVTLSKEFLLRFFLPDLNLTILWSQSFLRRLFLFRGSQPFKLILRELLHLLDVWFMQLNALLQNIILIIFITILDTKHIHYSNKSFRYSSLSFSGDFPFAERTLLVFFDHIIVNTTLAVQMKTLFNTNGSCQQTLADCAFEFFH